MSGNTMRSAGRCFSTQSQKFIPIPQHSNMRIALCKAAEGQIRRQMIAHLKGLKDPNSLPTVSTPTNVWDVLRFDETTGASFDLKKMQEALSEIPDGTSNENSLAAGAEASVVDDAEIRSLVNNESVIRNTGLDSNTLRALLFSGETIVPGGSANTNVFKGSSCEYDISLLAEAKDEAYKDILENETVGDNDETSLRPTRWRKRRRQTVGNPSTKWRRKVAYNAGFIH